MFYLDYPIAALKPAPYNPRKIDEQAFLALQHSIKTLGMVKPIIAGEDGTIVAGHQRSRAAVAVGQHSALSPFGIRVRHLSQLPGVSHVTHRFVTPSGVVSHSGRNDSRDEWLRARERR